MKVRLTFSATVEFLSHFVLLTYLRKQQQNRTGQRRFLGTLLVPMTDF